jgi:hypothetical protein
MGGQQQQQQQQQQQHKQVCSLLKLTLIGYIIIPI